MKRRFVIFTSWVILCMHNACAEQQSFASEPPRPVMLFRESFDDSRLLERGWFDGKLVVDHSSVILRSTDFPTMKFNQLLLTPYFGPGLLPHAQSFWIDELTVATDQVGNPLNSK